MPLSGISVILEKYRVYRKQPLGSKNPAPQTRQPDGRIYMEDIKVAFASNMIALRTNAGMTQAELAAKINYSDKSVSKWERAEALPDLAVAKNIADTFGVPLDYMMTPHDEWDPNILKAPVREPHFSWKMVTCVVMAGVWTLAALLFVIFWIIGRQYWMIFLGALPVSLVALLVLNSLWNGGRRNKLIVAGIVLSAFMVIYGALGSYRPWQLIFVLIPSELIVALSYRIKKTPEKKNGRL